MKNILIIAAREFRQIASMRSFWLTLLILPIALALGPLASRFLRDDEPDRDGHRRSHRRRRRRQRDRAALRQPNSDRADAAEAVALRPPPQARAAADPSAPWASHDRWYTDADIAQFRASGGLDAALAKIARVKPPETPGVREARPALRDRARAGRARRRARRSSSSSRSRATSSPPTRTPTRSTTCC